MPAFAVAPFLVAHALIHASFISPAPQPKPGGPAWPFRLDRSWVLSPLGLGPSASRAVGVALLAVVLVGYAAAALAVLGIAPTAFGPAVVIASAASLAMLIAFFHAWLTLGLAIDVVLLLAVLVWAWAP